MASTWAALPSERTPDTGFDVYDRFAGNNDEHEIETLDEFYELVAGKDPKSVDLTDYVFQSLDFSSMKLEEFMKYNWTNANFWGCTFPQGVKSKHVREVGAEVYENPPNLPFKAYRAFMYRQEELIANDEVIYQHYKREHGIKVSIAQTLHDYSIMDALGDYLENKTPVGIMGGHKLQRQSKQYRRVVMLARQLAQLGFLVVTGGGPGAMEAANLGAYLADRSDDAVDEALEILAVGNDKYEFEYQNVEAADNVLKRFGLPKHMPSLGIPTYKYGHEPSNRFATFQAKFFSNALREADLLDICSGGLIYTQGSAGTRQEIFQAACTNYYANERDCFPMILLEKDFWEANSVWDVVSKTSCDRPMANWLLCTDSTDEIVDLIVRHRNEKKLPLISNFDDLKEEFWRASQQRKFNQQRKKFVPIATPKETPHLSQPQHK